MRIAIPNTLKWLLLFVLLIAGAGGGYAWWFATHSDERLRQGLLEHFAEFAPHWDVRIGRARFDWHRRVHLYELSIRPRGEAASLVRVPEAIVTIDPERLAEKGEIDIRRIDIRNPHATVVRYADGAWNWQKLFPLNEKREKKPLAEWHIDGGFVEAQFEHAGDVPAGLVIARRIEARFVPSGRRQFRVQGTAQIDRAGGVTLDGRWNIDAKTWTLDAQMSGVAAGPDLVEMLAGTSAELQTKVAHLHDHLERFARLAESSSDELPVALAAGQPGSRGGAIGLTALPADAAHPTVGTVASTRFGDPAAAASSPWDIGINGLLDITLHAAHWQPGEMPEFRLAIDLRNGRAANAALPFSLHAVEGRIEWDNRRFRVRNLSARNGVTQMALEGQVDRIGEATPARFHVAFANLLLDERLRARLPFQWRRVYDSLSPSGLAEGRVTIRHFEDGSWRAEGLTLTVRDGVATHEKFPYTVTQVSGTLQQFDDVFEFDFSGQAGKRPVTVTGYVRGTGPESEAAIDIRGSGIVIDQALREACPEPAERVLERLQLEGEGDVRCLLVRAANSGPRFDTRIFARLSRCAINYADFPWRISDISGEVSFASADGTWRFSQLRGTHGTARVACEGFFRKVDADDPGRLELAFDVGEAYFDNDLQLALPPALKEVWADVSPQGKFDLALSIGWVPGGPPQISVPEFTVTDGAIELAMFRYPLRKVAARGSWSAGRLEISSFSAEHAATRVRLDGTFEHRPGGEWKLRLANCFVDDLVADRTFCRALPDALRLPIERASPVKPLSLVGLLELRGTGDPRDPVTAAWDVQAVFSGNKVTAGVDLENAHGRATGRGTWDGEELRIEGRIDLDSADVKGHHFTQIRGPYRMVGNRLVVGSPKAFVPNPQPIPSEERLTARFIDGTVVLDSQIDIAQARRGAESEFIHHTRIVLSQGKLEEYARQYLADARNLQGLMNGWLDLRGRGADSMGLAGRGQLQISPAAVYELPVIAQILKVLSFTLPDPTAFKYVLVDYEIDRGRFVFNRIDLVGDAISLRGRGTARFDGRLNLDFYSMLPRNQIPIPVINTVLGQVTQGWVGVAVRGTLSAPMATVRPVPELDNALKQFLNAFEGAGRMPEPPARPQAPRTPPAPRQALPLEPR